MMKSAKIGLFIPCYIDPFYPVMGTTERKFQTKNWKKQRQLYCKVSSGLQKTVRCG